MMENIDIVKTAVIIGGYVFLLATSGILVNSILSRISASPLSETLSKEVRDTGFVVGKCENILLLTFMLLEAYTALALVFAAKALVRREDMSKNSLYFLAGTMINVTYSIMMGLIVRLMIGI